MNNRVIVVFAYNRANMIERMLRSLMSCNEVEKYDIWIFFDAPKDDFEDLVNTDKVRITAGELLKQGKFKTYRMILREKHLGLAASVISGVTEAFDKYDSVICLEDDLIFSRDYLTYMSAMLDRYKENERIWSISGYSPYLDRLNILDSDLYLSYRASSLGWGMWKDRWMTIDWDVTDYSGFRLSISKRNSFSRGGIDMPLMLDLQMNGIIDSWAIRWCYEQWKQNKMSIFPKETRVEHIGYDGSATHAKKKTRPEQVLKKSHEEITGEAVFDDFVLDEFRNYYRCNKVKIIIKILVFGKLKKVVENGNKSWKTTKHK